MTYRDGRLIDIEDAPNGYRADSDQERVLESELHRTSLARLNAAGSVNTRGQVPNYDTQSGVLDSPEIRAVFSSLCGSPRVKYTRSPSVSISIRVDWRIGSSKRTI